MHEPCCPIHARYHLEGIFEVGVQEGEVKRELLEKGILVFGRLEGVDLGGIGLEVVGDSYLVGGLGTLVIQGVVVDIVSEGMVDLDKIGVLELVYGFYHSVSLNEGRGDVEWGNSIPPDLTEIQQSDCVIRVYIDGGNISSVSIRIGEFVSITLGSLDFSDVMVEDEWLIDRCDEGCRSVEDIGEQNLRDDQGL